MEKLEVAGLRVLLVEDEPLVSMLLEDMLNDAGCSIIGPAQSLPTAIHLLDRSGADIVLLDVNVAGQPVYSLATTLVERNIPFLFVTGYSPADIRPSFRDYPVLRKPFRYSQLVKALCDCHAKANSAKKQKLHA